MTSMKVFLHGKPYGSAPDVDNTSPLTLPSLPSLTLSQVEVAAVFHLPLNRFTDPRYLQEHRFRKSVSYRVCDVTDLVGPGIGWSSGCANSEDKADGGFGGWLETWGLTAGI